MQENVIVRKLGENEAIDRIASPLQGIVDGALAKMPILQKALKGTSWLGHALHPALTDFPIGAWGAGFVLDMIEVGGGSRRLRPGADAVCSIGFVSACLAAVTGLADWSETSSKARRVGLAHGLLNVGILALYGVSMSERRRGRRTSGIALASTGFGLLMVSGWLGRELAYTLGVGQTSERRRLAREALPQRPVVEYAREPGRFEIPTPESRDEFEQPTTH